MTKKNEKLLKIELHNMHAKIDLRFRTSLKNVGSVGSSNSVSESTFLDIGQKIYFSNEKEANEFLKSFRDICLPYRERK